MAMTVTVRDPHRTLTLRLRRRVRVQRSFDVEPLGDGQERHTCRECKTSEVIRVLPEGTDRKFAERFGKYRSQGSVLGVCKTCSQQLATERYPLPGEGWRK
jgi:hypothetical protein